MNSTYAIRAENLHYTYNGQNALSSFSLDVPRASLFGLLGPNGAGKSTFFHILSTLLDVQKGSVTVFGHSLPEETIHIRELIGVVFQGAHLDPQLTCMENLEFNRSLYDTGDISFTDRANELLQRFDLYERRHDRVDTYSGGMKRKLEIVMGLIHKPSLLLLDEPTAGLDVNSRRTVWRSLKTLREQEDLTALIATHDMEEAEICDTIAILNDGSVVKQNTPEQLKQVIGGDALFLDVEEPDEFRRAFAQTFDQPARIMGDQVMIELQEGHKFIPRVIEAFPGRVDSVTLRKPTLGDVFLKLTGQRLQESESNRR